MRKEMDELRSAIKEKTDRSVDRMVKATDSPFAYLNLSHSTGSETPRTILIPLRRLWVFNNHLTR